MLTLACATPPKPALPKRIARVRRSIEPKRMDSFKRLHESLNQTAKEEKEFLKDFFDKTRELWAIDDEDEEEY
jgi:hypothetical protein